jgi:hypothetical protein
MSFEHGTHDNSPAWQRKLGAACTMARHVGIIFTWRSLFKILELQTIFEFEASALYDQANFSAYLTKGSTILLLSLKCPSLKKILCWSLDIILKRVGTQKWAHAASLPGHYKQSSECRAMRREILKAPTCLSPCDLLIVRSWTLQLQEVLAK